MSRTLAVPPLSLIAGAGMSLAVLAELDRAGRRVRTRGWPIAASAGGRSRRPAPAGVHRPGCWLPCCTCATGSPPTCWPEGSGCALADVVADLGASGQLGLLNATTVKALGITGTEGWLLCCGQTRPGSIHDLTQVRQAGLLALVLGVPC